MSECKHVTVGCESCEEPLSQEAARRIAELEAEVARKDEALRRVLRANDEMMERKGMGIDPTFICAALTPSSDWLARHDEEVERRALERAAVEVRKERDAHERDDQVRALNRAYESVRALKPGGGK